MNYLVKYLKSKDSFLILLCLLPFIQLPFLANEVYAPHAWRQMDTLGYAYDFYKNGTSMMSPNAYWMGSHKTLLLEFPVTEYLQGLCFKMFSYSVKLGQFINLLFFSFCLAYFYSFVKLIFSKSLAQYSALIFLLLPLVFYYSHTFLVDFFALGCGFAFCYYFVRGLWEESWIYWVVATLFASLSFLVKAPVSFYLVLPLLVLLIQSKKWKFFIRFSWMFVLALIPFYLWQKHSIHLNSMAPDLKAFISDYRKFDDNSMWYFGLWEHRYIPYSWYTLWYRFSQEITGGLFVLFMAISGLAFFSFQKHSYFILAWVLGLLVMLLTFFNLNVIHNYYQLAFMPLLAIGIAQFIVFLGQEQKGIQKGLAVVVIAIVGIHSYLELSNSYFQKTEFKELGGWLEEHTKPDDIVVTTYGGLSAQCPLVLASAHRFGYSLSHANLNPNNIIKLMEHDATKFYYVTKSEPGGELRQFIEFFQYKKAILPSKHIVYLLDLTRTHDGKEYNPKAFD